MPTVTNNMEAPSQSSPGYPSWLDFTALRSTAIAYLGPLTGKLWTDYNVHDPGITTLEALIYGLMDLGYRTHLPLEDILARNPASTGPDADFITAAQALGNNPLTIIDYRKLLIDVEGVRNAWVERDKDNPPGINGLYQVYIELEQELDDFTTGADFQAYQDGVLCQVKKVLLAHRNLCEDFFSITFLCSADIGVCADIELDKDANTATVYQNIVRALFNFFSPTPQFYTLPQLLDRGTPIETIFAGRPVPALDSHGFLDTTELEAIPRRTEIHLSDIYRQVLAIPGVRLVRRLQLRMCPGGGAPPVVLGSNPWIFPLPLNTLPVYSIACSGLQFFQNGQPLAVDLTPYNALLELNFIRSGKILFPSGAPALDSALPQGNYRADLGDYYSIQNDFPQVYGIGKGSLPANVTPARLAQARQLKGFLLFFDQLLADYLAQLSHVRDLFALQPAADSAANHSYFIGEISSIPDLDALIRFPGSGANGPQKLPPGTPLVYPVAVDDWNVYRLQSPIPCNSNSTLTSYSFNASFKRDNAVEQLTLAFAFQPPQAAAWATENNRYFYTLQSPDLPYVLVSRSDFATADAALQQASLVLFLGQDSENYSYSNEALVGRFGFLINQSNKTYKEYLQTILEDGETYRQRRQLFLDHLLARFAEVFADYALLYLGDTRSAAFETSRINAQEKFIADLPDLSANRGRAMDYWRPGWNDNNISGLERRFKAYAGIDNWNRHHLCNFEVFENPPGFIVKLSFEGKDWFISKESFAQSETEAALQSLLSALARPELYQVSWLDDHSKFYLDLRLTAGSIARSVRSYDTHLAAQNDIRPLAALFHPGLLHPDIRVSGYEYRLRLLDSEGRQIRYAATGCGSEKEAQTQVKKSLARPQDPGCWQADSIALRPLGKLHRDPRPEKSSDFLDLEGFRIFINKNVLGHPDRCRYEVLDQANTFLLNSVADFASEELARKACQQLLHLLTEPGACHPQKDFITSKFRVGVSWEGESLAVGENYFDSEPAAFFAAEKIRETARQFAFQLEILPVADRWRFYYQLGESNASQFSFSSALEYRSPVAATEAARQFAEGFRDWNLLPAAKGPGLLWNQKGKTAIEVKLEAPAADNKQQQAALKSLADLKKKIGQLLDKDPAAMEEMIVPDEKTRAGTYQYQLVDKDHPKARSPKNWAGKADALTQRQQLVLTARGGYHYLEICLGGEGILQGSGPEGQDGPYYYQLKCRNDYFQWRGIPAKGLVLMESLQGYDSPEAAQAAFNAEYLSLLQKGSDKLNYGVGKWISLAARKDIDANNSDIPAPHALVPHATQWHLGQAGRDIATELALACRSYPIVLVSAPMVFDPCAKAAVVEDCPCITVPEVFYYGFRLFNIITDEPDWVSIPQYPDIAAATTAFYFFLTLLAYPGNFVTGFDSDLCVYYVKIREVLAVSVQTFPDRDSAWGPDGVEKFIGVSQSPGSFHRFIRTDNCGYSFLVACPNNKAEHPCKYETPEIRDRVRTRLIEGYRHSKDHNWLLGFYGDYKSQEAKAVFANNNEAFSGLIYTPDGLELARVWINSEKHGLDAILDSILDLTEAAWMDNRFAMDKDGIFLLGAKGEKIAAAAGNFSKETDWKKGLRAFSGFFPLTRKRTEQGGKWTAEYHFAIKFPGFPNLSEAPPYYMPCGCGPETPQDPGPCYAAWKNAAPYSFPSSAWRDYLDVFDSLDDPDAYQGVFDDCCGQYGIELLDPAKIVAINPQSYYVADDDCAAVRRAWELINAEGLELVEHILLRPCPDQDGQAEPGIPVCGQPTSCDSAWQQINKQGTDQAPPLAPFYPGADPYSFIATVVLPAWPLRFSKPENRLQLEYILQREAPSHILLRILWLDPHDMCRFERLYKKWIVWLAQFSNCSGFDRQAFMDFLFETAFPCWDKPFTCDPVIPPVTGNPCWTQSPLPPITQGSQDWLSQINRLYCWTDMDCADTKNWGVLKKLPVKALAQAKVEVAPVLKAIEKLVTAKPAAVKLKAEKPVTAIPDRPLKKETPAGKKSKTVSAEKPMAPVSLPEPDSDKGMEGVPAAKAAEPVATAKQVKPPVSPAPVDEKQKNRLVNARLQRYRKGVEAVADQSPKHDLAAKTIAFLSDPQPAVGRLEKLATELAAARKTAKGRSREQLNQLIGNMTGYWLDKACFGPDPGSAYEQLRTTLKKVGIRPDDATAFLRDWNPEEIIKILPALDLKAIRGAIEG